jgi:hypothetical protein
VAEIKGQVVNAQTGEPVEGAIVSLSPSLLQIVTDAGGGFTFGEVPAGPQTAIANATGFVEATVSVEAVAGQTIDHTIELEPDSLPWTFRGTGSVRIEASTDFGTPDSEAGESTAEVEIVLGDDGSATGTFTFHMSVTFRCGGGEDGDVTLNDNDVENTFQGTHDAGSFTLESELGDVTGTYDGDLVSGHQLLVSESKIDTDCGGMRRFERDLRFEDIPRQS